MSRAAQSYPRRGCSIGSEVAATGSGFAPVEVEEIRAVIRFWHRRAAYAIRPIETVNGEADFEIDMSRLTFALGRINFYEGLLAKSRPVALEPNNG
jgi:hypothetical protein